MTTNYDDVEYVLADIITEATGEPRIGRLERTLAKSALGRLRAMGLALPTPPADDVRALEVHYCPEHGDLLEHGLRRRDLRSTRCREAHTVGEIRGEVRPRGTVTDANATGGE